MTIPNLKISKKCLVLFSILLFVSFLIFIPQETYADSIFTAGWYRDLGTAEIDASCPEGKWRARIELRNDLDEPLLIDKLTIQALWYVEGSDVGIAIYNTTVESLGSHIFETDCVIDMKNSDGTVALEVTAEKDGYYEMKAINNFIAGGSALNKRKWKKTLYLASLVRIETPNIVYLFPENHQWISGREEHSEMKLWLSKTPLPDNITQVESKIIHTATAQKFLVSEIANIAEGEVVFSLPDLTKHGQYSWHLRMVRSTPSVFYNENAVSYFNFDPNPPILDYLSGMASKSGRNQNFYVATAFQDEPLPSSGICSIEIYANNGVGTPIVLAKTCTIESEGWEELHHVYCYYSKPFKEYLEPETYTFYAIAYDCVGNKTETNQKSHTVKPLDPSIVTISSMIDNSPVEGVPFEVSDITNIMNGGDINGKDPLEMIGGYETATTFESTLGRYTPHFQAPESHDGRPFSYWYYGSAHNDPKLMYPIWYGVDYGFTMHFGVSRLVIYNRLVENDDDMDADFRHDVIYPIKTRVEQLGGTPAGLLSPIGYVDLSGGGDVRKIVVGEINDLVLKFYDSEDGILKFSHVWDLPTDDYFCEPDPENEQQCQGSIIYRGGVTRATYLVQRKVTVESYLGEALVAGVEIIGSDGMVGGVTGEEGYYAFSSTDFSSNFTGILRAPETIFDEDDNEVEFGYWDGCDARPPGTDNFDCYIGGDTWYDNVTTTVKAFYKTVPDPETPFLSVDIEGDGTVKSDVGDICCGCASPACSSYFISGTPVTLTVEPNAGSYFVGWSGEGDCSGDNLTCDLIIDRFQDVKAEFAPITINYNLTTDSTAGGSVDDPGEPGPFIYDIGTNVGLVATADSGYRFVNWTGDVGTIADVNDPSTTITMNGDYSITANFEEVLGPTAAMECDIAAGACLGPGCVCSNVLPLPMWETFRNGDVQYHVRNMSISIAPAVVTGSTWSIEDSSGSPAWKDNCVLCDMTIQPSIVTSTYDIVLEVEDSDGLTASTSHPIKIKQDIMAGFECSLDGTSWEDCTGIASLSGQAVYFQDSSTPSEGATAITSWVWEKGDGGTFEQFASGFSTASTTLSTATNTVHLTVRDDHPPDGGYPAGRSAEVEHPLDITLPLPEYREVAPVGWLNSFLARLTNVFVRF